MFYRFYFNQNKTLKTETTFLTTNLTNLESYSSYSLQLSGNFRTHLLYFFAYRNAMLRKKRNSLFSKT